MIRKDTDGAVRDALNGTFTTFKVKRDSIQQSPSPPRANFSRRNSSIHKLMDRINEIKRGNSKSPFARATLKRRNISFSGVDFDFDPTST